MSGPHAVGDSFELACGPVTTEQLVRYAGASDDYNRIHYDQAYAAAAGLGGVIAHGMLTMAFMGRAVTGWIGPRGFVRDLSARFTAPVRPGDVVRVVGTVTEVEASEGGWLLGAALQASVAERSVALGSAQVFRPDQD